jgi:hypothetical protein
MRSLKLKARADFGRFHLTQPIVAGLVPATSILKAQSQNNRGGREMPGRDPEEGRALEPDRNLV